ncbi:MAG TPA: Uma2 family endonuclease [Chthonomonadaceae bacterium]|nr:Uma2 family endonuclease [Chthonomonadaceae bacterium]
MTALDISPSVEEIRRMTYIADDPIDFATWLELAQEMDTELVRGVMIDKMAAQYPHEWIFMWLASILSPFVMDRQLGVVLGSRTPIKISNNDGRLPDLVFVRADNVAIIHKDAIYGVPDLVIEIISENDRPSDLVQLETDYRTVGIPEIVFIDQRKKRVRYLQKNETDYDAVFLTTGRLEFLCIPGFWIEVEWLFLENKPNVLPHIKQLIEAAENG